jgi:anthranilate synthase component 1
MQINSINITEQQFLEYKSQGFNKIPLMIEINADLDTPLSIYLKLVGKNRKNSFLLESVIGGERFGRYSYIGLPSNTYIESDGFARDAYVALYENDEIIQKIDNVNNENVLDIIQKIQNSYKPLILKDMPRFCGGWVGYFSYETVNHIEPCLGFPKKSHKDSITLPNIKLLLCDELVVVDNLKGRLKLIVHINPNKPDAYNNGINRLNELSQKLISNIAHNAISYHYDAELQKNNNVEYVISEQEYIKSVEIAKEYINAGDIMQVVLSQRMQKEFNADPILLYRTLRQLNPSPYMYYYCFGDAQIVGSSPELLVRHEIKSNDKHLVTLRPIAGTRPRGVNEEHDLELAQDLLADTKECAEHTMLIDLARNDIGRIAKIGTVKVTEHMHVEKYSHVQHIVSSVEGEIRDSVSNMDILKAVFPAGTLSGAAKVRAMQIIAELETIARHIYGGGVGYMSFNGEMDIAIAIRTAVIQNNTAYIQAGAGIVADSVEKLEWEETNNKAKAVIKALEQV